MAEVEFNRRSAEAQSIRTETEIAVLQIQVKNLDEKIEELRTELKEAAEKFEQGCQKTIDAVKAFKESEDKARHEITEKISSLEKKISALEKWRWMLMGAGIALGSVGFGAIQKILGMG